MKFKYHKYWKHKSALDVFFCVSKVQFADGKKAVLEGCWCTQTPNHWCFTVPSKLIVSKEYDNWEPHTPKGNPKL